MSVGEGNKSKMNYDFLSSINKTRENEEEPKLGAQFGHTRFADLAGHRWRRPAEKQKGPNLEPQLHQLRAAFVGLRFQPPEWHKQFPSPGDPWVNKHTGDGHSHAHCHGLYE